MMATLETNDVALEAFLDAIEEAREAAEFERLMLGSDDRSFSVVMAESDDLFDAFLARVLVSTYYREPSALEALEGRRALERLLVRYPEAWEIAERVTLAEEAA